MKYTGLYRESIATRRKAARADVAKLQKSLLSLKKAHSPYAEEHMELLNVLVKVSSVYESAPSDLTPNVK